MPKRQTAASRKNDAVVSVDTDQADTSKAVTRVTPEQDDDDDRRGGSLADDVSPEEKRNATWLERNRAVNKRIGRITRTYDQRFAEMEARHQRELAEVRGESRSLRIQRGGGDGSADDAKHELEMRELENKLAKAMDDGNSVEVARLNREISRKETQYWAAKEAAARGESVDDKRQQTDARTTQQTQVRKPSPAGLAFTDENDWWDDPDFKIERVAANTIFAELVEEEGADPNDPRTYERVAKRLSKKFPELEVNVPGKSSAGRDDDDYDDDDDDDDDSTRSGARRRAQSAAVQHSNRRSDRQVLRPRGEQHLTQSDLQTMRTIGMNPDNNDHVMEFARAKRETADAERSARR